MLQDESVLKVDTTKTAEEQFNEFHGKLEATINHFLPLRTRRIPARKMRREPWLTPGLELSIKKCKSLYKNHIKDKTNDKKYARYLTYNQQLKRTKRHVKRKYYAEKCSENKKNSRQLWRTINNIIRRSNNKTEVIEKLKISNLMEYNGQRIANELARHFSTIGKEYAKNMKKSNRPLAEYLKMIPNHATSIFMSPTTTNEITRLIQSLPPKNSSGIDNINNKILKEIATYIATPLMQIFDKSMETGIFPSIMKTAKVVPLFKSKMRDEATNYRPISLLFVVISTKLEFHILPCGISPQRNK